MPFQKRRNHHVTSLASSVRELPSATSYAAGHSSDAILKAPQPSRHESRIVRPRTPPYADSASFSAHVDPDRRQNPTSTHSRPSSPSYRRRQEERSSSYTSMKEEKPRSRRSPPSTSRRRLPRSPSRSRSKDKKDKDKNQLSRESHPRGRPDHAEKVPSRRRR